MDLTRLTSAHWNVLEWVGRSDETIDRRGGFPQEGFYQDLERWGLVSSRETGPGDCVIIFTITSSGEAALLHRPAPSSAP